MRIRSAIIAISILALVAITGCATKPKSPGAEAQASSIQAEATGLAPSGDARYQSIDFALLIRE
jgi:hypothetical protein